MNYDVILLYNIFPLSSEETFKNISYLGKCMNGLYVEI